MTAPKPGQMRVVEGIDGLAAADGRLFVVVGVFDGLHRGHAYLLEHLRAEAARRAARPSVITFDHHPDEVLTGAAPPLLLNPEERLQRLEEAGVEVIVVEVFDVALRMTPYDRFIRHIAGRVDLAGFLMTPDSAFGHDRGGTPATVGALGRELGYDVAVIPPLEIDGRAVRSADIRSAIASGDLVEAERLLGHPYAIVGRAEANSGDADIRVPMPVALPPAGTYEVRVRTGDGVLRPGSFPGSVRSGGPWAAMGASSAATAEIPGVVSIDADGGIRLPDWGGRPGSAIRITFGEPGSRLPLQGPADTIRRS